MNIAGCHCSNGSAWISGSEPIFGPSRISWWPQSGRDQPAKRRRISPMLFTMNNPTCHQQPFNHLAGKFRRGNGRFGQGRQQTERVFKPVVKHGALAGGAARPTAGIGGVPADKVIQPPGLRGVHIASGRQHSQNQTPRGLAMLCGTPLLPLFPNHSRQSKASRRSPSTK